jgi:hypothetical protein
VWVGLTSRVSRSLPFTSSFPCSLRRPSAIAQTKAQWEAQIKKFDAEDVKKARPHFSDVHLLSLPWPPSLTPPPAAPSQAKKDARKAKHTKKVEIPVTKAMKKAKKHMGDLDDLDEDL